MTLEIKRSDSGTLPPFLVIPLRETPTKLRHAPGSMAVIVASLVVVALAGPWPSVARSLEATTSAFADGELWRLFTYVFPHEHGWWHVLVNMGLLALFGWQYERIVGTARFLATYAGSGAVGMALLFAFRPIDADRGLRAGASLAVFGIVSALTTRHALVGGWRGPAMPWAGGTCLGVLLASGLVALDGHSGATEPGVDSFLFGFSNHALGVLAGMLLGLAVPSGARPATRLIAGALALTALLAGMLTGLVRWT